MTPKEQTDLFAQMILLHPSWTPRFTSGFVHGVKDERRQECPARDFVVTAMDHDPYGLGYLTGFAIYRGADASIESWFGLIGATLSQCQPITTN